ncbi:hypothetical protein XH81_12795 [Bradyrhizobium sp. CCBAU 25360]|uniref:LPD38 domain-containing protein n=1 Tax=Bradyrhizobium sp. CCBAU 25360 TaxID=858425 RepID=UPI002306708F|nr:LPD38 domain-containing protein [Bradyrhizobium sp. CCBAU 25360]MDA9415713.1 hypothetical protein [Bradyrhizobium sp. CCBAU 25360]
MAENNDSVGPWSDYVGAKDDWQPVANQPAEGPWNAYRELSDEQVFGPQRELSDAEVFGRRAIEVPDRIPQAMEDRLVAGEEARKREGGLLQTIPQGIDLMSTPEGRTRLWEAVKKYPSKMLDDTINMLKLPGDVMSGKVDLSTEEGLDQAIGLGMLVAGSRLSKLPTTGKTSGMAVSMGEPVSRISKGPMGEIYDLPIGTAARSEDFVAAAEIVGGEKAPMAVQEKLLAAYEEKGLHPSEVAHDAMSDPVVAQSLLSSDKADLPPGGPPKGPPEPPKPPGEPPAPPPEGSFEAAQKTVLDKISIGESAPAERNTWAKYYRLAVDDLHPLKAIDEDAYQLARLTRGQFGKAEHFIEHGTFDFQTYKTNGKPLAEIIEPVSKDLDGFRAYLASKRAIEIEASGRKSGVDIEAAQRVAAEGEGKYGEAAAGLQSYQENLLAYLRDSGVISGDAFTAMREAGQNYVPFYRVFEPESGAPGSKGFGPGSPVKKLKGSERDIIDPLESIIKNTYAFISVAERNAVGIKLIDALKEQGEKVTTGKLPRDAELVDYLKESGVTDPEKLADFVQTAARDDGDTLSAWRDGKREQVKVKDPELVAAFRNLDQSSADMLVRVLAAPAKLLRAGATLSPDFIVRNVVRDFMTAFINSGSALFSPIDTAKGLVGVIRKDADFQNWMKGGGANATMVALDRRYLRESLRTLNGETGLMERGWNVVTSPVRGLRLVSELAENATRLAEFKKMTGESKADIQSAAYASREVTLDFARIGASMRAYNMITAFGNAQIQGLDRIGRAFADRPVNTTAKVAGGITLPSVLLWWANHDDPRYQELPHWQKDMFWIVMTKDHVFRIPKPFELGVVFGSGVERILDATVGQNKEAFDGLGKSIAQVIMPNYIPTAAQPIAEQWANRSSMSDRTLIPADMEKFLPEYQYTPYTTEVAKKLGQVVSAFPGMRSTAVGPGAPFGPMARAVSSPILVENYIRSWTGGLGVYALQAADAGLRKAGVLPDPVTPTPTLADIPVVKAFVVRYPSASTQSIQDFYDQHEVTKRFYDTWLAKAKEGDVDAMSRIQAAGGPMMFVRLDAIKETMSDHSKLVRDIYKNPTIKAEEKRQLIDGLYFNMIEIGKAGKELMNRPR